MKNRNSDVPLKPGAVPPLSEPVLEALVEALSGVRFGTVTVIVQDGRVVQIDRTERRRLKPDVGTRANLGSDRSTSEEDESI